MQQRARKLLVDGADYASAAAGALLAVSSGVIAGIPTSGRGLGVAGLCVLVAAAAGFASVRFGGRTVAFVVSPGAAAWLLAAVVVAPVAAAVVAGAGALAALRHAPPRRIVVGAGHAMLAASCGALLVWYVFGSEVASRETLAAATLAAVAAALVWVATWLPELLRSASWAQTHTLRRYLAGVFALEALLASLIVAAAVTVPLAPWAWVAVVALTQLPVWLLLRLLRSEFRHQARERSLTAGFSRYVPAALVEQVASGRRSVQPGGEQREITVLFCDVRGFTSWAERKDPHSVITEINALLSELAESVFATEGTLDKFTGDGLMAFWGAPIDQPDHAGRAFATAQNLLERIERINEERSERDKPAFSIGVGVHSGHALVGNVGHALRLDFTAVGDTVNLAARLEATTRDAGVPLLISEQTFLALPREQQHSCTRVESVTVKGRTERIRLYCPSELVQRRRGAEDEGQSTPEGPSSQAS